MCNVYIILTVVMETLLGIFGPMVCIADREAITAAYIWLTIAMTHSFICQCV